MLTPIPGHRSLRVVKVGGSLLESGEGLSTLARRLADPRGSMIVVHGGGPEISRLQERLALEVRWHEGLRVTTPEGMKATSMVLSGWMNKRVAAALIRVGVPAAGISGEDGPTLLAEPREEGRLGSVGEVRRVDPTLLGTLLAGGFVPVLSPVSAGPRGRPLNVNADEAAAAVAAALGAARLELVSDVDGVLERGVPLGELGPARARELLELGILEGGMGVKVRVALEAAARGVRVRIGGPALMEDPGAGTRILAGEPVPSGSAFEAVP